MTEIWIHRKCARPKSEEYAGDVLVVPKQPDEAGIEMCVICRTHTPTLGATYLHEGDEVNWTPAVEAVEATEGDSEEVAESIPTEVPDLVLPEKVAEVVAEEIAEATEEIVIEEAVEAESEPSDALADLDAQIADLKAKKDALET